MRAEGIVSGDDGAPPRSSAEIPAAKHTVLKIVEELGHEYDLAI
jgi:hypothetical protein